MIFLISDALRKAEETVEASFLALNVAQSHHKEIYHNLNDLLGRAMELGLKSKVNVTSLNVNHCVCVCVCLRQLRWRKKSGNAWEEY